MRNGGIHVVLVLSAAAGAVAACGGSTRSSAQHISDRDASPSGQAANGGASGGGGYGGRASGGVGTGGSVSPVQVGGFAANGGSRTASGGTIGFGGTIATGGTIAGSGGACAAGHLDCNGDPRGGCETDTSNDTANCGACANSCPSAPNALPTCSAGACGVTCLAHFGDCDGQPQNGCEDDLSTDSKNCSLCGLDCGNYRCRNGVCYCPFGIITLGETGAASCRYAVPPPDGGGIWNSPYVFVEITPPDGSGVGFSPMANSAACGATGGWYFEDPSTRAAIVLCPATCNDGSLAGSKVQIVFNCLTD